MLLKLRRTNRPFKEDDFYYRKFEANYLQNRITPTLIFGGVLAVIACIVYGIHYLLHINS